MWVKTFRARQQGPFHTEDFKDAVLLFGWRDGQISWRQGVENSTSEASVLVLTVELSGAESCDTTLS